MRKAIFIVLSLLPLFCFAQSSSHYGQAVFTPQDGKKLLIAGQDLGGVGGLSTYNNGYIDSLQHQPAGVTTYTSLPNLNGLRTMDNWGAGDVHANAYSDSPDFDNTAIAIGLYMVGKLKDIHEGRLDNSLTSLADWLKEQDRPIYLRVGYEFDGPWNDYNYSDFKKAWIYIVDHFSEEGVYNVAYVWQSAGINTATISNWYPGDEYVNWVGYSHFDGPNPGWKMREFAKQHNKPIMIAEATPKVDLKNVPASEIWNNWYKPLFDTIDNNSLIQALAYINTNWDSQSMWQGQGWGDSRLQVNDTLMQEWTAEIENNNWLLSSDNLFEQLGYPRLVNAEETFKNKTVIRFSYSNGMFHILNADLSATKTSVYNLQGTPLIIDNNEKIIDLSQLKKGIYLIRVSTGTESVTKKILI